MRQTRSLMKQSGDVHPPELDDPMDDTNALMAFDTEPSPAGTTTRELRPQPSLKPLLWIVGGLFLLQLMRR